MCQKRTIGQGNAESGGFSLVGGQSRGGQDLRSGGAFVGDWCQVHKEKLEDIPPAH